MECIELRFPPLPQLLTIGHNVNPPGWQHFRRRFHVYDMIIIRSGTFFMTEEDREYMIEEGGVLILEPGLAHWGHRPLEENTEIYWVHLYHEPAIRRVDSSKINWSQPLYQGTDDDLVPAEQSMFLPKFGRIDLHPLIPILDEMVRLHGSLSSRHALQLQALLVRLLDELQASVRSSVDSKAYRISELAASYIRERYRQPFDGKSMEEKLHYHFDYLARCLKKYTGMSPLQYHHHLQIEEAKRLLGNTDLSIKEVAELVGYSQPNYFIRLFRQSTSLTPGTYRNRHRGYV